ncbi:hypothetical protein [Demequina globuliformis]|uniref:hypothetical protein n=1 Tax=Demequina globuliformis TaxID=676202 RepID=UPI00078653C6|nr:hypothetical protein [Demequina globuliformis]
MTNDRKAREKAENEHFMKVLDDAIYQARLKYTDVDALIGASEGTTGRWIRNVQVMRAPTFVKIAVAIGSDPSKLMAEAVARMEAAGLLDNVETLPTVEAEQAGK